MDNDCVPSGRIKIIYVAFVFFHPRRGYHNYQFSIFNYQLKTASHNNSRKRYKTVCIHTYPHYPQLSPQQETKKSLKYSGIFWRYQKISTVLSRTVEIPKVDIMWITSGTGAGRRRPAPLFPCRCAGHPLAGSPPGGSPSLDPEPAPPEPRRGSRR